MISNLRACPPEQVVAQARCLFDTPVWALACDLRRGTRRLFTGTIASAHDLASLPTIFGDIGGHRPIPGCGRVTFTVGEVLPLLRCHETADAGMLRAIEALMAAEDEGRLECSATILRSGSEMMLVDGNKRTIAFYERRRGGDDRVDYPVFVVEDAPRPAGRTDARQDARG